MRHRLCGLVTGSRDGTSPNNLFYVDETVADLRVSILLFFLCFLASIKRDSEASICVLRYSSHPAPVIRPLHFASSVPDTWSPVDRDHDYEVVTVDPDSVEYHHVASAFHESVPEDTATVTFVSRVQNIFLWHRCIA